MLYPLLRIQGHRSSCLDDPLRWSWLQYLLWHPCQTWRYCRTWHQLQLSLPSLRRLPSMSRRRGRHPPTPSRRRGSRPPSPPRNSPYHRASHWRCLTDTRWTSSRYWTSHWRRRSSCVRWWRWRHSCWWRSMNNTIWFQIIWHDQVTANLTA